MTTTIYLRVAKGIGRGKPRAAVSIKPNWKPLLKAQGSWNEEALPTVMVALKLDIPEEAFDAARNAIEIQVPLESLNIAAEVEPSSGTTP